MLGVSILPTKVADFFNKKLKQRLFDIRKNPDKISVEISLTTLHSSRVIEISFQGSNK